jgi:uncharacterized protein YeaO (DUF488 family)
VQLEALRFYNTEALKMIKETYAAVLLKAMQDNPDAKFYIVMRWAPRWIGKEQYKPGRLEKLPLLSPSEGLLRSYQSGLSWSDFADMFRVEMESPACQAKINEIAAESKVRDVFLVCTEKPPKHCHRFLLLDEIKRCAAWLPMT